MGLSCFESCGNSTLNCSLNLSFPPGPKPIFGITLRTKGKGVGKGVKKQNHISFNFVNVLSANRLVDEFEFKPSFDEYLKTMESVKTGREKMQQKNHPNRLNKSTCDLKVEEENAIRLLREFEGQQLQNKSEIFISKKNKELYKNTDDGLTSTIDTKIRGSGTLMKVKGKNRLELNSNARAARSPVRHELECEETGRGLNVKRRLEVDTSNVRWTKNTMGSESRGEKGFDKRIGLRKQTVGNKSILEKSNGRRVEMERAAFKLLEESNDVLYNPRVSRMEMEERIQKLAKW